MSLKVKLSTSIKYNLETVCRYRIQAEVLLGLLTGLVMQR
jgi:hypothetical protein